MRSVKELLAMSKIGKVSHQIEGDAAVAREGFDLLAIGPPKEKGRILGMTTSLGKRQAKSVCAAWNVSESQLVRIALAELLTRYGFKSDGVLLPTDYNAVNRHPSARKPLTTRQEASQRKKRNLVEALDASGDDPPQPPGVHGSGSEEPAGE